MLALIENVYRIEDNIDGAYLFETDRVGFRGLCGMVGNPSGILGRRRPRLSETF